MKPMLAARVTDLNTLRFPLLVTPKLDGIRCIKYNGSILTRAFKPVPNRHIRDTLATLPDNLDGELMAGDFADTQSSIMTQSGTPQFTYHIFDTIGESEYQQRVLDIPEAPFVMPVLPTPVYNLDEFLAQEAIYLAAGYEGIMARDATGPYKFGRSTLREHWLMKYKRYDDSEAIIIGFEEALQNCNPIVRNIFGRAKRPGGRSLSQPKDTLGSFIVRDGDVEFSIGTGMDDELRQEVWNNREAFLGRVLKYSYQGHGTLGRPRFPSFLGFRHELDT